MKIIYKQNPLASFIELDLTEIKLLRLHFKVQYLEDCLFDAYYVSQKDKNETKFLKDIDTDYDNIDIIVEKTLQYSLNSLSDVHAGDCTSFPCSCMKCHTEEALEISTIQGIDKRIGSRVYHYFSKNHHASCQDAINYFETFKNNEYLNTINWLTNYKNTFLKEQ